MADRVRPKSMPFWPEVVVVLSWVALFFLTDVVFRDDESLGHRAAHVGLWLSLAWYVAVAVRAYRSTTSESA